jgi:hypothetical protein
MEQNHEQVPLDALMSPQEVAASGRADIAAIIAKYRPEQQRAKRLSEYLRRNFLPRYGSLKPTNDNGAALRRAALSSKVERS